MLWIRLFLPFAGAYFLSYHFRTANAVIGPVLGEELSLSAADLGLLTSAYFLAFGAAQLPLGALLDRFGARRVEAALLLIAAAGAALFAGGNSIGPLALARGLIGFGVSACLMASFKSFSQWFPVERQASLTGWIMTSGTLGALAASAPLDAALHVTSWRVIFLALSGLTLIMAGWLFFSVPDKPGTAHPEPLAAQWAGIRQVLRSRHFWRFVPVGFAQIGGFMSVQSLWSSAWLMHVNGYSRTVAADHLAAMSVAMVVSYALIGLLATRLARRGIGPIYLLGGGMAMALLTLLLIITQAVEQHYLLWIAYGVFSSTGTLAYSQTAAGFPVSLSGRANATLNLMVFLGAFSLQWGMGILIDALAASGQSLQIAHRNAFAALFVLQLAASAWLLIGGRRPAPEPLNPTR
jgi:sugar phosphate permease